MKWRAERMKLREQIKKLRLEVEDLVVANGKLLNEKVKLQEQVQQLKKVLDEMNQDYRYALTRDAEIQRKLIEKLATASTE